jgi:sugar lactone lactonase YvrE
MITLLPTSDTGLSDTDAKTNDDTPTLRVSLAQSSANAHAAGDVVTIYLGNSSVVGSVTLTAADVARGQVTVTTSSLGTDGSKSLTARASRGSATSDLSPPLSLLLDRTPPALAAASINGAIVKLSYIEIGSGIDSTPPAPSLFTLITDVRTANTPVRSTVNQANNTVRLELTTPVEQQTPVRLNYTSDPKGVRDLAGNLADSVTTKVVENLTPKPGTPVPVTPKEPPSKQPKTPPLPQKVTPPPNSNVIVTKIAPPSGSMVPRQPMTIDSTAARFNLPAGIARDRLGNLYVTDQGSYTVRKIAPNGAVTTIAGKAGESAHLDGPLGTSRFLSPGAIAVDQAGNLYVVDNRNLRKIGTDGNVSTMVITPDEPLLGGPNTFGLPAGLAVDKAGNVFVADYLVGVIWKVNPFGKVAPFVRIGQGIANLAGAGPSGIAIDAADNLYVSDLPYSLNAGGFSSIHKVAPDGKAILLYGPTLGLVNARGIGIDAKNNLYINENLVIVRIAATGNTMTAYQLPPSPAGGSVSAASIALNPESGAVYFTDTAKHTVNRLDPDGRITVIAGREGEAGAVDVER